VDEWDNPQQAAATASIKESRIIMAEQSRLEWEESERLAKLEDERLAGLETEMLEKKEENLLAAREAAIVAAAEEVAETRARRVHAEEAEIASREEEERLRQEQEVAAELEPTEQERRAEEALALLEGEGRISVTWGAEEYIPLHEKTTNAEDRLVIVERQLGELEAQRIKALQEVENARQAEALYYLHEMMGER
jgi:hypothetical protein